LNRLRGQVFTESIRKQAFDLRSAEDKAGAAINPAVNPAVNPAINPAINPAAPAAAAAAAKKKRARAKDPVAPGARLEPGPKPRNALSEGSTSIMQFYAKK
jgi:hypothetical protein